MTTHNPSVDLRHTHKCWHGITSCLAPLFLDSTIPALTFLMPYLPPPYPETRHCAVGREDVPLSFVQASTPNVGRPYYAVSPLKAIPSKPPSDHPQCKTHKWFRWADGLGRSPKASPTATQSGEHSLRRAKYCTAIDYSPKATLPGPQAEPSVPEQAATGTSKVTCAHRTCQIVRVAQFCQRRMCRKHCRSQGGCTYDGHHDSLSAQPSSSPPLPTPPLLDPSSHRSHSAPVTQNNSSLDAATESSTLLSLGRKSPSLSQIDPSLLLDSRLPSLPSRFLPDAPPPPPSLPAPLPLPSATSAVTSEFSGNPRYKSHLRSYAAEHVAATLRRTEL